jgi:hypothetical protein
VMISERAAATFTSIVRSSSKALAAQRLLLFPRKLLVRNDANWPTDGGKRLERDVRLPASGLGVPLPTAGTATEPGAVGRWAATFPGCARLTL